MSGVGLEQTFLPQQVGVDRLRSLQICWVGSICRMAFFFEEV